jgi:hypothetical protein
VPSSYLGLDFGPSNCLLRASSAFKLFGAGLRSLELSSLGQQCLPVIRGWASVPRIIFFGPAVPSSYSRLGFGPSNCLLRASSAFQLFEAGFRSLELSSSVVFFGTAVPSKYSSLNFDPSNHLFRADSSSTLFGYGCPNPRNASLGRWRLHFVRIWANAFSNLSFGLSTLLIQHARILVAIYQFGYRMSNTKVSLRFATPEDPVFVSNALCRENFPYLRYEVCTDGRIGCLTMNWASTW